jgi:RNA polymerase sigma factor (sigma-70 family)
MTQARLSAVARHLRSLVETRGLADEADGELLQRFADRRDETAFTALLRRHGPMVLAVGRRILSHEHDAEDVYQAAFLLLARQARSIRKREAVGSWLHGVAHRLAVRAKGQARERIQRERQAAAMRETRLGGETAWRELQSILDDELARLPENYRAAVVLCCLEAKTQEEAARQLGCPLGTVRSRLARGRKLLHDRLTRRGLTLSAAALATALTASTASAAPVALVNATRKAALLIAAGRMASEIATPSVAALVNGGLHALGTAKVKIATALLLAASIVGSALGYHLSAVGPAPETELLLVCRHPSIDG